jgi:hypothetical protein
MLMALLPLCVRGALAWRRLFSVEEGPSVTANPWT